MKRWGSAGGFHTPIAQQSKGSLSRAVRLRHVHRVWQLWYCIAKRKGRDGFDAH